jgi:hypothetical protein|eukprot:COSAG01_NODE_805_length_13443_cov_81.464928_20_plen_84_part_00
MNGIVSPDKSAKQLRVLIPPGGLYILTVRPNLRSIGILYQQIMKEKFVEEHVSYLATYLEAWPVCTAPLPSVADMAPCLSARR